MQIKEYLTIIAYLPKYAREKKRTFLYYRKALLMLKLTCLLTLIFLNVSGKGFTQETITLNFKGTSVEKVFRYIEKKSDFVFYYNNNEIRKFPDVNVSLNNASIRDVLQYLSGQLDFQYNILDNKYIIIRKNDSLSAAAYNRTVHGRITDSSGNPLGGATVNVKGTKINTLTDAAGNFTIDAPEDAALVITMVGYATKEVPVQNGDLNIILASQTSSLNDVVVTALGITRQRRAIGYAETTVSGSKFTQARESNVAWGLEGMVAGVNVVKPLSGSMGSSSVVIRGNGSITGNSQALYVLNGLPIINNNYGQTSVWYGGRDGGDGISSINPDDIESMTVLKGGTAAALYGAKASNGAILINTKNGISGGENLRVDYNTTFAWDKPVFDPGHDIQYEYGQGINGQAPQTQEDAWNIGAASWGARLDGKPVIQFDGVMRPYSAVKNNFQNFYSGSNTFTNNIAVYGGTEKLNARFSVTDMNNHDLTPNSSLRRDNFTLSANMHLGRFTGHYSVMYITQMAKNPPYAGDASWNGNTTLYLLPTNYDIRTLKPQVDSNGNELLFSSQIYFANPYFVAYRISNTQRKNRLLAQADMKYDFTNSLYARVLTGEDYNIIESSSVMPASSAIVGGVGRVSQGNTIDQSFQGNVMLGYDKTWHDWSLNAIAGGAMQRTRNPGIGISGSGLVVPDFYAIGNLQSYSPSYGLYQTQINSLYGYAELGFRRYLYLTMSGRNDWFSTLNPNSNNIFYPAASLSYVMSDNLRLPSFISFLKLRAAWAKTGNDGSISPYSQDLTYTVNPVTFKGQVLGGLGSSTVPNKFLQPISSTSYEAGFESQLFHNRFGIDFTYYSRKSSNDILSASISETSGFSGIVQNAGEVSNKGIELLLTGTPVQRANFSWNVSWNFAYNKSKILSLLPGQNSFVTQQSRPGLYGDGGVPVYITQQVGKNYGMIQGTTYVKNAKGQIVYDDNGLPEVGPIADLGRSIAPIGTGISNGFQYKNFHLDILVDGKFGGRINGGSYNLDYVSGLAKATLPGRETGVVGKGVTESGAPNTVNVPAQTYYTYLADNIAQQFVYKSDFIKLRQIVLGYSLPQSLTGRLKIREIRVSFVARDLFTLYSKVPLVDPESTYLIGNVQGLEQWGLPATRSFGLNLNVKF